MSESIKVPLNTRLTARPLICIRQRDMDAARLQQLSIQLEDLQITVINAPDESEEYKKACAKLFAWTTDNSDEFRKLKGDLKCLSLEETNLR